MTKIIDADSFLKSMENLYTLAGWNEREVHFSLADLRMDQAVLYGVEKRE